MTTPKWQVWDASAEKELQPFGIPAGNYEVVAWSRDGAALALGTGVYDLETGRQMAAIRVDRLPYALAWAPDGFHLAVWVVAGTGLYSTRYDVISLIEASTGRQTAVYDGGVSETGDLPVVPSPLAWSPDGQRLLVVRSGVVEIWILGQG